MSRPSPTPPPPSSTVAEAAALASVYADRLLVRTTRDVHQAVSRRMLTWTRQTRTPIGRIHDGMTSVVYGSIGLVTRAVGRTAGGLGKIETSPHTLAGRTLAPRLTGLRRDVECSRRGRRMRSAVNGLIGDVLRDQDSPIAINASVRHPRERGTDVTLTPGDLAAAYPAATGRIVVFLHGLCEDDEAWGYQAETRGPSYLDVLDAAGRWTPVAVRFNSGLPIRDNATEVVRLVNRLVDGWPVRVDEVAFVGHSMGGLVVRAAAAAAAPSWWAGRVSHVVLLGSPHAGAPLERFVERSVPLLRRFPEVEPFAAILDERSVGIRDLQDGIGVDAALWPEAAYHCVGATLGTAERAWAGRMFGDLLVLVDSARGTSAEVHADFRHLTGAHHFDLLNHPEITTDLLRWLGPARGHMGGSTSGSGG